MCTYWSTVHILRTQRWKRVIRDRTYKSTVDSKLRDMVLQKSRETKKIEGNMYWRNEDKHTNILGQRQDLKLFNGSVMKFYK